MPQLAGAYFKSRQNVESILLMSSNRAKLKRINYPMIILMIFLIYTAYVAFSYFNKKSIFSYEVRTGSLAKSNIYQGVAIRDEEIVTSIDTGYVEYFAREGEHVGIDRKSVV